MRRQDVIHRAHSKIKQRAEREEAAASRDEWKEKKEAALEEEKVKFEHEQEELRDERVAKVKATFEEKKH